MSHSGTELRRRGEGWLKAGTRLNGNWGIPERRAKTGALVSTESSSAERANTVGRGVVGGERRFKGGRTLPGNPSLLAASPLDPPPPPATMPRYQYRLCRRFHLLYQRGPRFSTLPRLLCPSTPSPPPSFVLSFPPLSFGHSTQLRPLFRPPMLNHCPFSSVSRFPPV